MPSAFAPQRDKFAIVGRLGSDEALRTGIACLARTEEVDQGVVGP